MHRLPRAPMDASHRLRIDIAIEAHAAAANQLDLNTADGRSTMIVGPAGPGGSSSV
jgi:hypothetical protein